MELLVVRHAIAEERAAFAATGRPDGERPLTAEGRRKMRRGARGLARIAPPVAAMASSPLVRAVETARILAPALGLRSFEEIPELAPEAAPEALLPWLRRQGRRRAAAIVGHEPHLGRLVSWLVSGQGGPLLELGKGGACLVVLPVRPGAGSGRIGWVLAPGQLRKLAR
jgi:phosphohistidine phosphatase